VLAGSTEETTFTFEAQRPCGPPLCQYASTIREYQKKKKRKKKGKRAQEKIKPGGGWRKYGLLHELCV
jgi:hypothetical protein